MLVKSEGIILQNIKYADRKIILKVFTKQYGLITFYAATGKSPNSKIKNAAVLPLSFVELSFPLKQNKNIQQLYEVNLLYVYDSLGKNFHKLAIAQFLNEVLIKCIKEHLPNEELFEFVITTYKWLNETESGFSNLHIYFVFQLTKHLGFEPHNNYEPHNLYFNTREGKFTPDPISFPMGLNKEQSALFAKVLSTDILTMPLVRSDRNEILESFLALYKMHVEGFNDLKSYDVLKELFV